MNSIRLWFRIARPGTLAATFSPVFIGLMIAANLTKIDWITALVTLISGLSIQIISNFVNDYYDFKKGLDKAGRVGFKRAIAEGEVTPSAMKKAIIITTLIAVLSGLFLIYKGGIPILSIGIFSLLFAWLYTATSKSLSYLGIADLFVLIFFGPVATVGTTYLQTHAFSSQSFWFGIVCGLISTCVLVTNNVRDYDTDKKAGKKSLPVRLGKKFGEYEYLVSILAIIPVLYIGQARVLPYLIVIPGIILYIKLLKAKGTAYNQILVNTGKLNLLFALLCALEFLFLK
ncbi:MAG: 1,4-dihydroxy-2-naphthoate octaprenyltransferase [Bacteroidales bacterium]